MSIREYSDLDTTDRRYSQLHTDFSNHLYAATLPTMLPIAYEMEQRRYEGSGSYTAYEDKLTLGHDAHTSILVDAGVIMHKNYIALDYTPRMRSTTFEDRVDNDNFRNILVISALINVDDYDDSLQIVYDHNISLINFEYLQTQALRLDKCCKPIYVDDLLVGMLSSKCEGPGRYVINYRHIQSPFSSFSRYTEREIGAYESITTSQVYTKQSGYFYDAIASVLEYISDAQNVRKLTSWSMTEHLLADGSKVHGLVTSIDINTIFTKQLTAEVLIHTTKREELQAELYQLVAQIAPKNRALVSLQRDVEMLDFSKYENTKVKVAYITDSDNEGVQIHVHTNPLILRPNSDPAGLVPSDGIDIGEYHITIGVTPPSSGIPTITMKSKKGTIKAYNEDYMNHPHVFNSTNPCLGDFMDPIIVSLEDFDYFGMIDIMIMFLEQADNHDCAGKFWPSWLDGYAPESYMYGREVLIVGDGEERESYTDDDGETHCQNCDELVDDCGCF